MEHQSLRAVHWLRSLQEEDELAYWLSFVAYNRRDQSLNNRLYLIYIIAFFSVWIFVVLTLFASGGAVFLRLIDADDPARAAALIQILLLGGWGLYRLWMASKRSPLVFSNTDEALLCQMPVDRRHVTLRWFGMPWFISAVPFWLAAVALGFSLAENRMPGEIAAHNIFEYAGYGIRAWIAVIPIHLALLALIWAAGIFRLHKDANRPGLAWAALLMLVVVLLLVIFALTPSRILPAPVLAAANLLAYPIQAGFGSGRLPTAPLYCGLAALAALAGMVLVSRGFSLSRAAQETQEIDTINTAARYGLTTYARDLRARKKLGVRRAPSTIPALPGRRSLLWKDLLQSQRTVRVPSIFDWVGLLAVMLGYALLPDPGSRAFALAFWVIQVGKVSVERLRSDLSCWPVARQLPISHMDFIRFDLSLPVLLSVLLSLSGILLSTAIISARVDPLIWLVPGLALIAAGTAAHDIVRRSNSSLLLVGSVPERSAAGIALGVIFAAVPFLLHTAVPGAAGILVSALLSLGLGYLALRLTVRSYRKLGD